MNRIFLATALLIFSSVGASAGFLDSLFSPETAFWRGAWGVEGKTPVIRVTMFGVSYEGVDRSYYPVSHVDTTATKVTFQAGAALVTLTKRSKNQVMLISQIGKHASVPVFLCKSNEPRCR